MTLPYKKDIVAVLRDQKRYIHDDYRAVDCESDTSPSVDMTFGTDGKGRRFGCQTGDNSYTGDAYGWPHWAIVVLRRRSNCEELADEVLEQWADLVPDDEEPQP